MGTLDHLTIRNLGNGNFEYSGLIKFDLSNVDSYYEMDSAFLNLYYYEWWDNNPNGRELNVYSIESDWNEETMTWYNQPSHSQIPTTYAVINSKHMDSMECY